MFISNGVKLALGMLGFVVITLFISFCSGGKQVDEVENRVRNFDSDWRFKKDNISGAEQTDFDDSEWRKIDLPHDWSIEDLPNQEDGKVAGPFTINSGGPRDGMSNAHVPGGTGWYRKSFVLEKGDANKELAVYFEGAYMETDVWINGNHVKSHKHGYTSFLVDLTKQCKPAGEKNTLAVRVINKGQNSRWYSGSGIYRHVKLVVTNPVHVAHWGVYITTPVVSDQEAKVQVVTEVLNQTSKNKNSTIRTKILDAKNQLISETETPIIVSANSGIKNTETLNVLKPNLWWSTSPYLYQLETTVLVNGNIVDQTTTSFGIRSLHFSAENGFMLNGKKMELKGGCVHHDNGILGAVAIDRAEERRVELLKANGFNAIRCSHNPPSEKFLEACDRLGMLVINEPFDMWQKPKNKDDYHLFFDEWWERDFSAMILRDRNHPSVILWSIGNEIEERAEPSGVKIVNGFKAVLKKLDPSRLITEAVNDPWDHPGNKWDYTAPAFALLDVGGYNYQWWEYENDHKKFPDRIMLGTESVPKDAMQNWQLVEKHSYIIGDFVWTAMDYLGESGLGHSVPESIKDEQLMPWPWFNANCGDIDLIGNKKPQSFYRDVVWNNSKLEMAVHAPLVNGEKEKVSYWGWPDEQQSWNWSNHENELFDVNVYTRSPLVRLELNGKVIGEQKVSVKTMFTAKFKVPYKPGELKAIAIENGKETARVALVTTGKPYKVRLFADRTTIRANRNDLSYVMVEIVDKEGRVVPDAEIPVTFTIEGTGELAATGSANPSYMTSFKQPQAKTFRGKCLVILRPTGEPGEIKLTAEAPDLEPAKAVVQTTVR